MIAFDIETSGFSGLHSGIVALGAVDMNNPKREFYIEARLDEDDKVFTGLPGTRLIHASAIHGFSLEDMSDPRKISQEKMIEAFNQWMIYAKTKILLCQNPAFDIRILFNKAEKHRISANADYHTMDMHTVAQVIYAMKNKRLLTDKGLSKMGLGKIASMCGLETAYSEITSDKKALQDARLTAECFSRLVFGKNLFKEFSQFKIPKELVK